MSDYREKLREIDSELLLIADDAEGVIGDRIGDVRAMVKDLADAALSVPPPAEPVPEDERDDRARRYIAVVQAPEGYPPPDRPHATEASIQPTIHSVVLEDDYLAALRASRPSPAPQTAAGAEGDYSFAPERDPASSRSADAPPAAPALTPEAARGLLDTLDAAECEPEFNPSWLSGAKSALRTLADVSEGGPSDD